MGLNTIERTLSGNDPSVYMAINHPKKESIFKDSIEHLEALEYSARVRVVKAFLRDTSSNQENNDVLILKHKKISGFTQELNFNSSGLSPDEITPEKLEMLLRKIEMDINQRVRNSLEAGIHLNFEHFCKLNKLDDTERIILILLISYETSKSFRNLFRCCELDPEDRTDSAMTIGSILTIVHSEYRDQISSRKYFNIKAPLIKNEIVIPGSFYVNTTNILDMPVHLHERAIRFILEDNNIYDTDLQCISRKKGSIGLDQVIISGGVKREIVELTRNYLHSQVIEERTVVEKFYGYGTGLTLLFYGPSGTGKTMLAHALSNELDMELLSVNFSKDFQFRISNNELINTIFKEAKLCNGIVFFDECDDVFSKNTEESRNLLIEIEKAGCITIFATNKVIKLDPALDRRINLKIPFQLPDEHERLKIWKALLPPNASFGKDVDLSKFARNYVFTGGLIKNTLFMATTNTLVKNKNSNLILTSEELERAAEHQTCRMLEFNLSEKIFTPQINMKDLFLRHRDKEVISNLIKAIMKDSSNNTDIKLIMGCSDIQTGTDCAVAVAKECNLKVRMFNLPDMLIGKSSSRIVKDNLTQDEIDPLEYIFRTFIGHSSVTLLVDDKSIFERYLKYKEDNDKEKESFDFYNYLERFKGILFLITNPVRQEEIPIEFNYFLNIHLPPEEFQIRQWVKHFNARKDIEDKFIQVVEHHPLHLNEIDLIANQFKRESSLNGDGKSIINDHLFKVIGRYKNKKHIPVLFGANGNSYR